MSETTVRGNGLGFGTVLFLIFLVLKLTKVIDWSWWWVTAPLWGVFAILAAVALVLALVAGACYAVVGIITLFERPKPVSFRR